MLPSAVASPELRDTHCVRPHRFINRLPVSSHTYTHSERGERDRQRDGKKNSFVQRLSGNKRRMGAVTSESDSTKETGIDREKKGNQRDRQRLVMEKLRKKKTSEIEGLKE